METQEALSNLVIRRLCESDIPYLYEICLKTGDAGSNAEKLYQDGYMLGQYYAAPYLFYSKDTCFIAELDGMPKGYILGVANSTDFYAWMEKTWLPPLRSRYSQAFIGKTQLETNLAELFHKTPGVSDKSWIQEYPAHLHIDLLPQLQGKGTGRKLMTIFLDNMREKGVSGVHLGVDGKNLGAYSFYQKMGFSLLEKADWGAYFGIRLN